MNGRDGGRREQIEQISHKTQSRAIHSNRICSTMSDMSGALGGRMKDNMTFNCDERTNKTTIKRQSRVYDSPTSLVYAMPSINTMGTGLH